MFKNRWYGTPSNTPPTGIAQVDLRLQKMSSVNISEGILRLAQEEYDRQHPGQPYEKMQSRGGLSVLEILSLLADHIERLKANANNA